MRPDTALTQAGRIGRDPRGDLADLRNWFVHRHIGPGHSNADQIYLLTTNHSTCFSAEHFGAPFWFRAIIEQLTDL